MFDLYTAARQEKPVEDLKRYSMAALEELEETAARLRSLQHTHPALVEEKYEAFLVAAMAERRAWPRRGNADPDARARTKAALNEIGRAAVDEMRCIICGEPLTASEARLEMETEMQPHRSSPQKTPTHPRVVFYCPDCASREYPRG